MALLLLALLAVFAPSMQRPGDVVKWSASAPAKPVVAGGEVRIALTAKVEGGWKLYALTQPKGGPLPLSIVTTKGAGFAVDPRNIVGPRPKVLKDENFKLDTLYYEDEAEFTVPVRIPKTTSAGRQSLSIDVTFQACGESICLRPFTQRVGLDITVVR